MAAALVSGMEWRWLLHWSVEGSGGGCCTGQWNGVEVAAALVSGREWRWLLHWSVEWSGGGCCTGQWKGVEVAAALIMSSSLSYFLQSSKSYKDCFNLSCILLFVYELLKLKI